MSGKRSKPVTIEHSLPYSVRMEYQQRDRILGGGGGDGTSVDDVLDGMAAFPFNGAHKVVSITQHEGICFAAQLERNPQVGSDNEKESATLTVWAPNEEDARELLQRTIRAHYSGPGWWEFNHPNYRGHAGNGRDEDSSACH